MPVRYTTNKLKLWKGLCTGKDSTTPIENTELNLKFLKFYVRNTKTSGDNRLYYGTFYLAGAGNGGESMRSRTVVEGAAGTAHGAHFGLEFGASGSVSGLGIGLRGTFIGKNAAAAGTVAGGMSELYAAGASTNYATADHAIHRFVNAGDGTGAATAKVTLAFDGLSTGTTGQGKQLITATMTNVNQITKWIRCWVNGAVAFIPISVAEI